MVSKEIDNVSIFGLKNMLCYLSALFVGFDILLTPEGT